MRCSRSPKLKPGFGLEILILSAAVPGARVVTSQSREATFVFLRACLQPHPQTQHAVQRRPAMHACIPFLPPAQRNALLTVLMRPRAWLTRVNCVCMKASLGRWFVGCIAWRTQHSPRGANIDGHGFMSLLFLLQLITAYLLILLLFLTPFFLSPLSFFLCVFRPDWSTPTLGGQTLAEQARLSNPYSPNQTNPVTRKVGRSTNGKTTPDLPP